MSYQATFIPAWPRSLTKAAASSYCSCRVDELPPPSYGRRRAARWLIEDLNAHLDALAGLRPIDDEMMDVMG